MKALQIFKKSFIAIALLVVVIALVSCTKSKYYKIINENTDIIFLDSNNQEITRGNYGNNTSERVTIKLDLSTITKNKTMITKQVTVNGTPYVFLPIDKTFEVTLNSKKANNFISEYRNRELFRLDYHEHYFDITSDGETVASGNSYLEGSKINVKSKNLPANIIVKINDEKQVKTTDISFYLLKNSKITYHSIGDDEINDEQILNNQIDQINLPLDIYDTLDSVSKSFNFIIPSDKTITAKYFIKENSLPKGINIKDNKFIIGEDFAETNPVNVTIVCELHRNTTKVTKEFKIKVVKDSIPQEINEAFLEKLLKNNKYFLKFNGAENIESTKSDIEISNQYDKLKLTYEILNNHEYLLYDAVNKKLVVSKDKFVIEPVGVDIKVTLAYTDEVKYSTTIKIKLVPNFLSEERTHEITNPITINPKGITINGKKVIKRTLADESIFNQVTVNKNKTKFVFNEIGETKIFYKVDFEDNTSNIVVYTYNVILPKTITYVNNYLTTLENSLREFKSFNPLGDTLKTPKVVGTDNLYLPDIVLKFKKHVLTTDKIDFELKEVTTDIDFTKDLFKIKVYNAANELMNEDLYELTGTSFKFIEQEDDDAVYTINYYLPDHDDVLFAEYIKVQKGVNAYEDYELRKYFRELLNYDYIFLQRNIKVIERKEVVEQYTFPSGEVVWYRKYNWAHSGDWLVTYIDENGVKQTAVKPLFDAEGNITKEQQYYQGSLYYRYFSPSGSRRSEYKPVKFNGNHYSIDASQINYCYDVQSYIPVPDVQCAVFDVDSGNGYALPYHMNNEIKNIQIIGNGGISGKTIKYDEGREFSVFAGSIHALRARVAKIDYNNIVTKDTNGVLWASQSEINIDKMITKNSFGYNVYYRNRMGLIDENRDTPMTRLKIENSYLGETGGIGISIADADRRLRMKDENMSDYIIDKVVNGHVVKAFNEELHAKLNGKTYSYDDFNKSKVEDRIKYSCDPTVVFKNTEIASWVSTESSLVKSFNLTDKIHLIEEQEELIKKHVGIQVLKKESDLTKLNASIFLINNNLLDKNIPSLTNDDNDLENSFFFQHNCPRWEVQLNTKYQYYPCNIVENMNKDVIAKLSGIQVLLTAPGANFKNFYESKINKDTNEEGTIAAVATHLLDCVNERRNLPLDHFLQIIPIAEFPIFNNGSEKGKIPAMFIIGYDAVK